MDPLAIFALAVGIGLFVLIALVSIRFSGGRRRSSGFGDQGAILPYGDDSGGYDGG